MNHASSPLTWAAVLGLLGAGMGATAACSSVNSGGACNTASLPDGDPCKDRPCCDVVTVGPDGGALSADAGGVGRICGACNG